MLDWPIPAPSMPCWHHCTRSTGSSTPKNLSRNLHKNQSPEFRAWLSTFLRYGTAANENGFGLNRGFSESLHVHRSYSLAPILAPTSDPARAPVVTCATALHLSTCCQRISWRKPSLTGRVDLQCLPLHHQSGTFALPKRYNCVAFAASAELVNSQGVSTLCRPALDAQNDKFNFNHRAVSCVATRGQSCVRALISRGKSLHLTDQQCMVPADLFRGIKVLQRPLKRGIQFRTYLSVTSVTKLSVDAIEQLLFRREL